MSWRVVRANGPARNERWHETLPEAITDARGATLMGRLSGVELWHGERLVASYHSPAERRGFLEALDGLGRRRERVEIDLPDEAWEAVIMACALTGEFPEQVVARAVVEFAERMRAGGDVKLGLALRQHHQATADRLRSVESEVAL